MRAVKRANLSGPLRDSASSGGRVGVGRRNHVHRVHAAHVRDVVAVVAAVSRVG